MCIRDSLYRAAVCSLQPLGAYFVHPLFGGHVQGGKNSGQDDRQKPDVYKRQALAISAGDHKAFKAASGVGPKLAQRIVLEPVSYTHLDVYKRQAYRRLRR